MTAELTLIKRAVRGVLDAAKGELSFPLRIHRTDDRLQPLAGDRVLIVGFTWEPASETDAHWEGSLDLHFLRESGAGDDEADEVAAWVERHLAATTHESGNGSSMNINRDTSLADYLGLDDRTGLSVWEIKGKCRVSINQDL